MSETIRAGTKGSRKRRNHEAIFSDAMKERIWARDKGLCVYCHGKGAEIDHVVPRSKGGPALQSNGVVACQTCNDKKSNTVLFDWVFIAFYHLLVVGESLEWLDKLWDTKLQHMRGRIQALSEESEILRDVLPSPWLEIKDERCIVCQEPFQTKNELRRWCSQCCARIWGNKQEPEDRHTFFAYLDKLCLE